MTIAQYMVYLFFITWACGRGAPTEGAQKLVDDLRRSMSGRPGWRREAKDLILRELHERQSVLYDKPGAGKIPDAFRTSGALAPMQCRRNCNCEIERDEVEVVQPAGTSDSIRQRTQGQFDEVAAERVFRCGCDFTMMYADEVEVQQDDKVKTAPSDNKETKRIRKGSSTECECGKMECRWDWSSPTEHEQPAGSRNEDDEEHFVEIYPGGATLETNA